MNQESYKNSFIRRISTDYLLAVPVVILTILIGIAIAKAVNIEIKFYPIPFMGLWWLFLLEIFNIIRILYEESKNKSGIPLIKLKTAVFLFYPILSGCWMLSPWVIFRHNKIAANLAISSYEYYWVKNHDIDHAFDSAMILYYCTQEPTFLHAIPEGIIHGSDKTNAKAQKWFIRVLTKKMKLEKIRISKVINFMITPLLKAETEPNTDLITRVRILNVYKALQKAVDSNIILDKLVKRKFYKTMQKRVQIISP